MMPHSKEESPLVGTGNLFGRGWDMKWSKWAGDDEEKYHTGAELKLNAEFALGWSAPLWSDFTEGYEETYRMINFEPNLDLDLGFKIAFSFHLYFISWEFSIDLMPYKFRPFDFVFQIDAFPPRRYCFGFDYFTKGLALEIMLEQNVHECSVGLLGIAVDDWNDC